MGTSKKQKKRDGLRYREFVLSPYGVIKIKSLGYIDKQHPNTQIPKKGTRKRPLSPEQKQENKIISGIRITVEHAIAGIKRLGCMTQILRNRRPFIDDTFLLLSAGLWNFHLRTA